MENGPFGHLVRQLSRLPGLGPRSARRIALHLLTAAEDQLPLLAQALVQAAEKLRTCSVCGNLDDHDPCALCQDSRRDPTKICIVSGVADIWAIERTHQYKGLYHVLGGILSAMDGVTPDHLRINGLLTRVQQGDVTELILALPATVDGGTTAHYLQDRLHQIKGQGPSPRLTRLALGMPMGGELDYLDDGTIGAALKSRAVMG